MANWTLEDPAVAQDEAQDQVGARFAPGGNGRHYSTWETSTFNDRVSPVRISHPFPGEKKTKKSYNNGPAGWR